MMGWNPHMYELLVAERVDALTAWFLGSFWWNRAAKRATLPSTR